jgi:hypothetical protein
VTRRGVFMRFLYLGASVPLENLWNAVAPNQRRRGVALRRPYWPRDMLNGANSWSSPMLDFLLLALGLGFFVLSVGYVYACDRL